MDLLKFVQVVKQNPAVWDRSNPFFRDKDRKEKTWTEIGSSMNTSGNTCRETFKSLREKYIRERDKSVEFGSNYKKWALLNELTYLEPHIVSRKQSMNSLEDAHAAERFQSKINQEFPMEDFEQEEFDKNLIILVRKTEPIWDRNCNTYPNRQVKRQLWETIGQKLKQDANICILRWKALREKYIRQKNKLVDGEQKWELLDELRFLDKVILYRKKCNGYNRDNNDNISQTSIADQSKHFDFENFCNDTDSSSEYIAIIKEENPDLPDSPYSSTNELPKRKLSYDSDEAPEKKRAHVEENKETPETIFGNLVSLLLMKKPQQQRSLAMVQIMQTLSK